MNEEQTKRVSFIWRGDFPPADKKASSCAEIRTAIRCCGMNVGVCLPVCAGSGGGVVFSPVHRKPKPRLLHFSLMRRFRSCSQTQRMRQIRMERVRSVKILPGFVHYTSKALFSSLFTITGFEKKKNY